jgi:ATP/maltotriose-dependent transcriptional regulator MalT
VDTAERHAEQAVQMVVPDDMFSLASTRTDLGLVRERQGRLDEAEALLRESLQILARTGYNGWDQQLSLATFLLRQGRLEEGREALAEARRRVERYGPASELPAVIDRFGAAAAAQGGVTL